MVNKLKISIVVSSVIIMLLSVLFIILTSYARPPIGDDILLSFFGYFSPYYNPADFILGDRICSIFQAFQSVKETYMNWGGRIVGFFLMPFISIYGDWFIAAANAFILLGIILSTGVLIFGNIKKVLLQPFFLIFGFLVFVYFYFGIHYLLMWAIMAPYGVSALLCLVYIYFIQQVYDCKNIYIKDIIFINLLGFITGVTHEIYIFMMFIFLLILFIQSKEKIKHLVCNVGIFVGAVICIFAPGNFVRMKSVHDESIFDPYLIKLTKSLRMHGDAISGYHSSLLPICLLLFILFCILLFLNRKQLGCLLKESKALTPYFFVLLSSPFIWAVVSYAPSYGLLLFTAFFWVFVFKLLIIMLKDINHIGINFNIRGAKRYFILTGSRVVFFFGTFIIILNAFWIVKEFKYNYSYIKSNIATRVEWNKLILEAQRQGRDSVMVPKFKEQYSNRFNFFNENNKTEEFEKIWYRKYYQLLVIPTDE